MHLATKTMKAIEDAMVTDQGAKYRGLLRGLMPLAEDAYREHEDDFRSHLGASLLGRECAREIWYSFRWSAKEMFTGQKLRLFNRGHLEEPRMIALLQMIGCQVWFQDEDGKQFRIKGYRNHAGGGMDGVAIGIPDLPPDEPCLTEFKTHNQKSFDKLVEHGVLRTKWEHFVQMQEYMGHHELKWALYGATNKNTDDIHMELVQFDQTQFKRYEDRSAMIVEAMSPPPKIKTDPTHFYCKSFCKHNKVCHYGAAPERNCRTCRYITLEDDGKWSCGAKPLTGNISKEIQLTGCGLYELNPVFKNG